MDLDHLPEFPHDFGAAFRGEAAWPPDFADSERDVIDLHGMLPLVYRITHAPALRGRAMRAAALEPLLLDGVRLALTALHDRGVKPLILKGGALAYTIYPEPELRPRMDTDLLVAEDDFAAVRDAFLAAGFDETTTSGDTLGVRQRMFHRFDPSGFLSSFDVHLDITNNATTASALRYDELLARATPLPAISEFALGLSTIDALLYACIHRVVHHHATDRLIWLYDVRLLRDRLSEDEVRELWQRAAERRVVAICRDTLAAAQQWFGGAGDDAETYLNRIDHDEPSRAFLDRDRTRAAQLAGDLAALPGFRARLTRMRQLAFPPRSYMADAFGEHGRAMLPLLYLWRGVRGVLRLFRKVV